MKWKLLLKIPIVLQEVSTECRRNMKHPESPEKSKFENSGITNGSKWHVIDGARTILALPCLTMRIAVKFLIAKHLHLARDVFEKTAKNTVGSRQSEFDCSSKSVPTHV
jgi:hypothetical protein